MKDIYDRKINYLRISVTDLCNLRCRYCMPAEGVKKLDHSQTLTHEEIVEITRAAVELGIDKVRITGGEPLVHRDIVELCRSLGAIPGIRDMAMTTNATLLAPVAEELKAAGINRINISLDTLDPEKYRAITRLGNLEDALSGIRAAFGCGMSPVKLNAVLIGGFNDDEIASLARLTMTYPVEMRFIELMPIGDNREFGEEAYIPNTTVLQKLPELVPVKTDDGVARLYTLPGAKGKVGLISPLSHEFCNRCSRLRLTSDGYLKPCLHSAEEIPVRGLHGEELKEAIRTAIYHKPARHPELSAEERSESKRGMNEIGG
jgi:cyclic pyranopterin phosphate synthase